ncbi:MAG: Hint domain-containing protein [Paracoccus sp. (in: a-proteobacteria)]|nr:Hint domain-containing protein [Paracoccus sp. (in: a-proteobacteria)]
MAYLIKAYSFGSPVPVVSNLPLGGVKNFSFADATETRIYLDDADGQFNQATRLSQPGQRLLIDTDLGGVTVKANTVLTYNPRFVTLIRDDVTGANYYAILPYAAGTSAATPAEIGDRTTVLILPLNPTTPEFNPANSISYAASRQPSQIAMAVTQIPPGYLSPTCFATGTLIETANGPRPVETLVAGDLVMTRDHGLRALAWAGGRRLTARHLDLCPNLRPIRIRAGALGPGIPATDLTVSPQHRVLVASRIAERLTGSAEVLVAAKHLCAMPGISVTVPADGIGYHHILFDRHEIVRSNGCWTESLFTGPVALNSVSPAAQREIRALFPGLFGPDPATPEGARTFMTGRLARELTRRHIKNARPLVA